MTPPFGSDLDETEGGGHGVFQIGPSKNRLPNNPKNVFKNRFFARLRRAEENGIFPLKYTQKVKFSAAFGGNFLQKPSKKCI